MARSHRIEPGTRIGSYVVVEHLGEGAVGAVYLAVREGSEERAAVKVLKGALSGDISYVDRFRREAKVAIAVEHPHLVPVIEYGDGDGDGRLYIAAAFRDGGSLGELVERDSELSVDFVIRIAAEIGAGLGALHARGIVHRDVKPSNVMLDSKGSAALTDFGLARGPAYTVLTTPGQVLGTLDYMAPELIEGKLATPATDVYALGCLAYECLTGTPPFSDKGIFQIAVGHLENDPPDPRERRDGISDELAATLLSALAKEPARRPPTATAYAHLLRAASGAR